MPKTSFVFRIVFFIIPILAGYTCVFAQEVEITIETPIRYPLDEFKELPAPESGPAEPIPGEIRFVQPSTFAPADDPAARPESATDDFEREWKLKENDAKKAAASEPDHLSKDNGKDKFHWRPALMQSMVFLGIQHGFRLTQNKTRRELDGPFFDDWGKSVSNLRGWNDGDSVFINYVAHGLQGALTGRIFVNNSDRAKRQEFGASKEYWRSRAKAFVWSTAWSTQFEIGPISEASLGNVGQYRRNGRKTSGYVDFVTTPTVGTGILVGEDAIDKYILKNWLEKDLNGKPTTKIKWLRSLLTPTTAFSNILRWKAPWKREHR